METNSTWDLTNLYPSCESKEFLKDLHYMTKACTTLEQELSDSAYPLEQAIASYELILDYLENLQSYATCCLTSDTSNAAYLKANSQVEEAALAVQHLEVVFLNHLGQRREEVLRLSGEGQSLASYGYVLTELLEEQEHLMDSAMEDLAADLARSGTDAFSRLQEAMGSSLTTEWEDGTVKTVVQLRNEASNPDRTLRKLAFEKELALWKAYEIPFASALNGVKGTTLILDRMRTYSSPLDRSLAQSRIDRQIIDVLISTLEKNLPMFRRYLKSKAKLLGLEKCAFYDLFAPVGKVSKSYTYEEAQSFIVEKLNAFSPKIGSFARNAFDQKWVDAYPRRGKVGGAYDIAFPIAKQSRILANFDQGYGGVSTLAHELGHGFHDSVVLNKSHLMRTYPMTLAETASLFNEFLIFQGALEGADGDERISLIEHFLQEACQVCVDILSRYKFESWVFDQRTEGELTSDAFCSLMEQAQKETYGDALCEYHPYMWAVKGHYYSSDFSFYNYPYAFGQLFALGLYAQKNEDGTNFAERYTSMLAMTGSLSAKDVAATMGIDIASVDFWQSAMDIIASYESELFDAAAH